MALMTTNRSKPMESLVLCIAGDLDFCLLTLPILTAKCTMGREVVMNVGAVSNWRHTDCAFLVRHILKLSGTFSKVATWRHLEPRHRVGIISVGAYGIAPPHQLDSLVTESEENDHSGKRRTSFHGCLEKIWQSSVMAHCWR